MKNKLKNNIRISFLSASVLAFAAAGTSHLMAEEKGHDHAEHAKAITGPNEGKIIASVEPHLEFFVTKERKVRITAIDDKGKATPIGDQKISIIAGDRSNPTRMSFEKDGDSLLSDKAFPEGNDFPVVIQIKTTPDAKTTIEKFNLDLSDCPTCKHLEYACTCGH